ncbi:MAG: hypothetical protein KAJ10_12815 [Thermodesulfovibrionia bacterium]|nr:hypothetical protein [Thermodesulfovibrionia bacterium]
MATAKRTVKKEEVKPVAKVKPLMVTIPYSLLKQLVRLTGNRQARMFMRKAAGISTITRDPSANLNEQKPVEIKEAVTKPTPKAKVEKRKQIAEDKKAIDKVFKKLPKIQSNKS